MPLSAKQRAARVEALVFDVDGVLTCGEVIYGPGGEWKVFNIHDGHGFMLAKRAGLKLGLITGRVSKPVELRARELGVDVLMAGVREKGPALRELCRRLKLAPGQIGYVGDDVVDLAALALAGFPVAVANAVAEVKARAAWVTRRPGGRGAAREVVEFVLKAKKRWKKVLQVYEDASED